MPASFEKLHKILKLEQNQGYRNRAVIGGLETFAEIWRSEAEAEVGDEGQPRRIAEAADQFRGYNSAERAARARIVQQVLDWLAEGEQAPALGGTSHIQAAADRIPGEPAPSRQVSEGSVAVAGTSFPFEGTTASCADMDAGLEARIDTLPGVKAAYEARLQRLGIQTVGDLLYHYPHRYEDYRSLNPINKLRYGEETTIVGVVWETTTRKTRGGAPVISSIIADGSGTIEAVWFNQPYLVRQLRPGLRIVLSGKVDEYLGRLTLQSPAWEPLDRELIHTARLVPVYPLTSGLTARWLRRLIKRLVDYWTPRLQDHLPLAVRERAGLMDLSTAIQQIHFPDSLERAQEARRRLSFDEFLLIQLGMLRQRHTWQSQHGVPLAGVQPTVQAFIRSLPFQLTDAQQRSLSEVLTDLAQARPMSRLLQGDVGSGKTAVAAAALLAAVTAGKQAALMAPTEILAEQHFATLTELFGDSCNWGDGRRVRCALLVGSLARVDRARAYAAIASGEADIVVGTQALIQKHVTFKELALIVVDEQHRFGVIQRATLREKGSSPHVLVMSATPIPRSLALTIYGDLDISVIDQVPAGRLPVDTRWLVPSERERAYAFLRSQIRRGRQAFILYPLIEESESQEARAATEEFERLRQDVFPDLRLGLLHGRIRNKEKDEVMTRFRDGEIDILVSTSVIEVGIDVPNASVMLIEGADRFGLAQLHQFRGRVGRGSHQSYCLLISDTASPDDPKTKVTWERLKAIEKTQDGFLLAEKDLELRGPGDFLGVRQSGLPELRLASLSNLAVLELARAQARALFEQDPTLSRPEHHLLAAKVARFWQARGDLS